MAHPGGRPLKFKSVEELKTKIDAYFADCDPHPEKHIEYKWPQKEIRGAKGKKIKVDDRSQPPYTEESWIVSLQKPYTITGLANFLDTSRATLVNCEEREEFFNAIKAAKDKVEAFWEHMLIGSNVAGIIFNLKNNYGWRDQQDIDHTTKGEKLPAPILSGASKTEE